MSGYPQCQIRRAVSLKSDEYACFGPGIIGLHGVQSLVFLSLWLLPLPPVHQELALCWGRGKESESLPV